MNATFQQYLQALNQEIEQYSFGTTPKELYEPIHYILSLGGKRLRPMLALMAYQLGKDDWQSIVRPAAAVEVFHNFTLMHDDIMDNAPLRRGKATVHEKWNANIAILSGDAMLVKAYDMLLEIAPENLPTILPLFNKCAVEVCEGQQIDMNFEAREEVTVEEYIEMIRLKTAVLLGFSLEMGGILGGLSDQDTALLRSFGMTMGIGFQLKDDLLDVFGDQEKFGKRVGGDILANKKTFLLITALATAQGKDREELHYWLRKNTGDEEEKVKAVTAIFENLKIRAQTEQKISEYFDASHQALLQISVPEEKKYQLLAFKEYLINREN